MKQYLHSLDYVIWIATIGGQWALLFLCKRFGLRKSLPKYFWFVAFLCLQATALFSISEFLPYRIYFWSFYSGLVVETILLLCVLYDVFRRVFDPLSSLRPKTLAKLGAAIAVILILAITLAFSQPAANSSVITSLVRTLHRSTEFVIALSFWSLVMYARALGIPWRSRLAGIAAGFLVYLSVDTATTAAFGFAPQAWLEWCNRLGNAAFLIALVMWVHAVRQQEPEVELPAPAALLQLRSVVAQMRSDSQKLTVQGKTRWIEE